MATGSQQARFPGESAEYRRARNALLRDEIKLRRSIEAVAARRRTLPPGGAVPVDYEFDSWRPGDADFGKLRMSELFRAGKQPTLVVYNFMFPESPASHTPCPSCTSIIDSVDGAAQHLDDYINFAIVAKAPISDFARHARSRGWQHALFLSSAGNTFNRDYLAEAENGQQFPLAHVFTRRGKRMRHSWTSELWFAPADTGQDLRHVDFMWPVWNILDLTPGGRGKRWYPKLSY